MANVGFTADLLLDGQPYLARRLPPGGQSSAVNFIPEVSGQQPTPQLNPANTVTFHHGCGASRKVSPGMISHTINGWTYDPGYATAGPLVTTVSLPNQDGEVPVQGFAEQDGHIYVLAGRYVLQIPNGSDAPVLSQDLGAGVVANSIRRFKDSLFVSTTDKEWELPSGGAWTSTQTGAGNVVRGAQASVFWTAASVTEEHLVTQQGDKGISYVVADPRKDTDYSPNPDPIKVGPYPITNLVSTRDHVYIATTGGLRDLDGSGLAPNLTPEIEALEMATNGRAVAAGAGFIYYGAGYGLMRVQVISTYGTQLNYAKPQWCTPGLGMPNETPGGGLPMAILRQGDRFWFAQYDPDQNISFISVGRDATADGESVPMVWNMWPIVLDGLKVTALWTSGLVENNPRLWIAVTDGVTTSLRWAPLSIDTPYQDLRLGRPYRFCTDWEMVMSYEDFEDDLMPKIVPELVAEAENLGAGTSLTVSSAVDGSPAYTPLGTMNASPRAVLRPTSTLRGNRFQPKLVGTGLAGSPAILRKVSLRAIPRPDTRELRHYQIALGRYARMDGGQYSGTTQELQRQRLAALQTSNPITLRDEDGASLQVIVSSGVTFADTGGDVGGNGERYLTAFVEMAVIRTAGTSFVWGDGTRFGDVGKVYS